MKSKPVSPFSKNLSGFILESHEDPGNGGRKVGESLAEGQSSGQPVRPGALVREAFFCSDQG